MNNTLTKEYAVVLKNAADFEEIHQQLITRYSDDYIPNRSVIVANYRSGSERITHYMLTDDEARILEGHPSIQAVEIPPHLNPDVKFRSFATYVGNFAKTANIANNHTNWGLFRSSNPYDVYGKYITSTSYTTVSGIPYGDGALQKVDLSVPNGTINGVIFVIHGGAWTSQTNSLDPTQYNYLLLAGYIVIDVNYRSVDTNAFGGNADGQYPNNVNDIETVLNFSTVPGAGSDRKLDGIDYWAIIRNYVDQYGFIVSGNSAGGHLAVMGAAQHGYNSGIWPAAVISAAGPMDLLPSADNPIAPIILAVFIDPYVSTDSLKANASPRYKFGTSSNPGIWYNAMVNAPTTWVLIGNNYDTVVSGSMIYNFAYALPPEKRMIFNLHQIPDGTDPSGIAHNYNTSFSDALVYLAPQFLNKFRYPYTSNPNLYTGITIASNGLTANSNSNIIFTVDLIASGSGYSNVLYWKLSNTSQVTASNLLNNNGILANANGSIYLSNYSSNTFTVYLGNIPNTSNLIIDVYKSASFTGNIVARSYSMPIYSGNAVVLSNAKPEPNIFYVRKSYNYTLTGKGVDIVILDSGITPNHPEWNDSNGVSRLQQIDWYTASGLSGTQSANHYLDYNGHGSHVASIAAGLTQGWAKNSKIYAVKGAGLEGSEGGAISATDAFDVIRLWHLNKPIEPSTGFRRPTIVNMSIGLTISNANLPSNVNYRGSTVFLNTQYTNLTELKNNYGLMGTYTGAYIFPYYSTTYEAEVQDMINAGIHVVVSAGDNNAKIDVPGGIDYDNFYSQANAGPYYYHRGSGLGSRYAIVVGNINQQYFDNLETREPNSETGPGVHLYAPGTHIMGVSSKDNGGTNDTAVNNGLKTVPYSSNNNYNMMKATGTSMSAPQVVGILACMLELNPGVTPAEAKNWLINKSIKNIIYDIGDANLYNNPFTLTGGNNRYLYNPYNSSKDGTMSNGLILRNTIIKLM